MKTKQGYRLVTKTNGGVASELYRNWCKNFPYIAGHHQSSFFDIIYQRVVEGREKVGGGWGMIGISLILMTGSVLAYLAGLNSYPAIIFFLVSLGIFACGITWIEGCKPNYWDQLEVEKYIETVCSLLWNLIDYETISYEDGSSSHVAFPENRIRLILCGNDFESLVKRVDSMLVHFAFIVRRLEGIKHEGDPELLQARNKRERIHKQAVALGLADANPQTHFDRAIPAAEKVAKAPVKAS